MYSHWQSALCPNRPQSSQTANPRRRHQPLPCEATGPGRCWTFIQHIITMEKQGIKSSRLACIDEHAALVRCKMASMDNRVTELHCIMPIGNIPSVLTYGILSHESAAKLKHHSVAMPAMQDRRDVKTVSGGLRLHQYANLYFHARNPMLSARRHEDICVLRVSTAVLQSNGTVIADQNAASKYVRFYAPAQSSLLNFDDIYARDWRHPDDQIREWQHKSRKCAEVLVPQRVQPNMLIGAYVVDDAARTRLNQAGFTLPINIDADFFFR